MRISDVKEALGFDLLKVSGCIASHEHLDHSKSIKKFMEAGIDVYSSLGTFNALGITGHRAFAMTPEVPVYIGSFKVLPFNVEHDASEPFGFLINHPECGNVLFATDTGFLKYSFENLNNIIVELNYSDEILESNIASGRLHGSMRNRVYNTHMSLSVLIDLLKANDLTHVANIVLVHLSDTNSNAEEFRQAVIDATGKNVIIADKNIKINFNISPF